MSKNVILIISIIILAIIIFLFHRVGYCEVPGWEGAGDSSISSTECSKIGGRYLYKTQFSLIFSNKL